MVGGSAEQLTYEAQARTRCLALQIPTFPTYTIILTYIFIYFQEFFPPTLLFGPTLVFETLEYPSLKQRLFQVIALNILYYLLADFQATSVTKHNSKLGD